MKRFFILFAVLTLITGLLIGCNIQKTTTVGLSNHSPDTLIFFLDGRSSSTKAVHLLKSGVSSAGIVISADFHELKVISNNSIIAPTYLDLNLNGETKEEIIFNETSNTISFVDSLQVATKNTTSSW